MIEFINVSHKYNQNTNLEIEALCNINLKIEKGIKLGLIGSTGSGKSTFLHHINGLLKPTHGTILFNGIDIKENVNEVRKKVGIVFQIPEHQIFEINVFDEIAFALRRKCLSENQIKNIVTESLNKVGLSQNFQERITFELSGGEKRKVAIASILATNPQVLILDEPSTGLDNHSTNEILKLLDELNKLYGITIILSSHDMNLISAFADKVIIMDKGKIIFYGNPLDAFQVENLQELSLEIPDCIDLVIKLRKNGFDIPINIYSPKELSDILYRIICDKGELH